MGSSKECHIQNQTRQNWGIKNQKEKLMRIPELTMSAVQLEYVDRLGYCQAKEDLQFELLNNKIVPDI